MTEQEAFDNLKSYYCEEEDHHSYIRESWQTLKTAVLAQQTTNNESHAICNNTMSKCANTSTNSRYVAALSVIYEWREKCRSGPGSDLELWCIGRLKPEEPAST